MNQPTVYNEDSIQVLDALQHIRLRPGMYIGEVKNPYHLFQELIDNAVDEFLTQNCKSIFVTVNEDVFTVQDDGRGIPVGRNDKGVAAELVFTELFSGGKFSNQGGYSVSAGLHGVGLSAVSALSEYVEVEIEREGYLHRLRIEKGKLVERLAIVGPSNKTGTKISFKADQTIFTSILIPLSEIRTKLLNLSLLLKGLHISYSENGKISTYESRGITDFVETLFEETSLEDGSLQKLHEKPLHISKTIPIEYTQKGEKFTGIFSVDWCCYFTNSTDQVFRSFVNCVRTKDGGTHVTAYRKLLYDVIRELPEAKGKRFQLEDILEATISVLSIRTSDVSFTSQTKEKFNAKSAMSAIPEVMEKVLGTLFEDSDLANIVINQAVVRRATKEKSRKLLDQTKRLMTHGAKVKRSGIPGLVDCTSTSVEETELFLLEGGSAAGTVRQARNPKTQAVLALKGKIINAQRTSLATALKSEEIRRIIDSIGSGISEECNSAKSRYGKILILTDADPDGEHIAACLITMFHIFMRPLIEAEMIYIVDTPLFMASDNKGDRVFARSQEEIRKKTAKGNWRITRMKGWGEANVSDMRKIAMDDAFRQLITLEPTDRDDNAVSNIMGPDSSHRKLLINPNQD